MIVIAFYFPQRVDESFEAAGEEPSPATEDCDPDIACQGKPTSKPQPHCPTFLHSSIMYLPLCNYYIGLGLL